MKKTIFNLITVAVIFLAVSCGKHKEATEEMTEWAAMDDFHMIMAESYHPYKDSANIAPAIANAAIMAEAADKWAGEQLPEKVNNDDVKGYLAQLKQTTADFVVVASSGDTVQIQNMLTQLHDDFHKIQQAWYEPGKEGSHEHEH